MPRKPRFYLPGLPAHVVQRGKETISHMLQYLGRHYVIYVDGDHVQEIGAAWQTGTPLGDDWCHLQIEETLKRKAGQARRGCPVIEKLRKGADGGA